MYFILFKKYRNVLPEKKLTFFHNFIFYLLTQISILYNILNINAAVAQLVERRTENPYVVSSILTGGIRPAIAGLFLCRADAGSGLKARVFFLIF